MPTLHSGLADKVCKSISVTIPGIRNIFGKFMKVAVRARRPETKIKSYLLRICSTSRPNSPASLARNSEHLRGTDTGKPRQTRGTVICVKGQFLGLRKKTKLVDDFLRRTRARPNFWKSSVEPGKWRESIFITSNTEPWFCGVVANSLFAADRHDR
jgi:hypothetical protein